MLSYGGDYNPQQWPEEVWDQDIALMRTAGVNLATLGVFAWSRLEPEPGRYRFDWLDRALDLLHAGGIRVALATPTASPPPWFGQAHPDALTVTHEGIQLHHGSRDTYCASAPAYRDASRRVAAALATRYAGHPALALWHVHNEYGTTCFCDHAAARFRDWLRDRYGCLDRLNDAWTTVFWSQEYTSWAQIHPPRATQYLPNPAQVLDFRRFTSDELRSCFREQADILRAHTPTVPVTTNFPFGGWVPVDGWAWAPHLDLISVDCYPDRPGPAGHAQAALLADLARGLAGRTRRAVPAGPAGGSGAPHPPGSDPAESGPDPADATARPEAACPAGADAGSSPAPVGAWLLMEQSADLVYTPGRMLTRPPGELTRQTLSHIARGADGALFFQWRCAPGGAELFHAAMLPHAGPDTEVFREVTALGRLLARLGDPPPVRAAAVAIAWDYSSWWASQGAGLPADDLDQHAAVARVHAALYRANVACDLVDPAGDLTPYALVLVPALFLAGDAALESLRRYAAAGGSLAVWHFSGVVDDTHRVRPGGFSAILRDLLGVRVTRWHPLPPERAGTLSDGSGFSGWREDVVPAGARVVAGYPDGGPAVTRYRPGGAGTRWYISTRLDDGALAALLARVCAAAGVAPALPDLPDGVEAVVRGDGQTRWLFLLNHCGIAHEVPMDHAGGVPAPVVDLVTGATVADRVHLPPGGCAVLGHRPSTG